MIHFFEQIHHCLQETQPNKKISAVHLIWSQFQHVHFDEEYPIVPEIEAGLPANLQLVSPKLLPRRRLHSLEGRAAMIHAIMHIEFNAINLALDALYRFRGLPKQYYYDWLQVAQEEAYHFHLLNQHFQSMGYQYGDFPAHNGLWEMAQKTGYDPIVRMALVPRLLEARGLDAAPDLGKRLHNAGDLIASEILGIIFHDEIGHVATGNRWYYFLCEQRQIDPLTLFLDLLKKHAPDFLKGPFAKEVRRIAGFRENELEVLNQIDEALAR